MYKVELNTEEKESFEKIVKRNFEGAFDYFDMNEAFVRNSNDEEDN